MGVGVSASDRSGAVSTIIAAHNAASTIARAVHSALTQPETAEVLVVDDASTDATRAIAEAAAREDARVRVLSTGFNRGPGAARNLGLEAASAPVIAVLDSDDVFLPGRFGALLAEPEWDLIADNIVFGSDAALAFEVAAFGGAAESPFEALGLAAFVRGNLPVRGVARGELGFLKPLMRRAFLVAHGLRYDPALRLGEDFDLYTRALLCGARMKLTRRPGYGALVRSGSLSARHGATDLARLCAAAERHLVHPGLDPEAREAMQANLAHLRRRRDHRVFLETRRREGAVAALRFAFGARGRPWPLTARIVRDKLGRSVRAEDALPESGVRLLLPWPPEPGRSAGTGCDR